MKFTSEDRKASMLFCVIWCFASTLLQLILNPINNKVNRALIINIQVKLEIVIFARQMQLCFQGIHVASQNAHIFS